ncbi:hypothetical protein AK830_g9775 [Neonectria ditissima]|uniref:Uncharacterized protein n=1 Tax=Neonectria ditissima TaxID=78410 RepID=A0A0P7B8I5_9HYPO|nr:hypothetical protein AK830_g9775 [Neonectria ditissima]
MSFASRIPRGAEPTGHSLGLGWLLAFSLGGAVLLFTCVGLLLAWRIKSRPENDTTTTIYEVSDRPEEGGKKKKKLGFTKRLTRRKYVRAQSTSRLSLSMPPLLPPLPTYQSFGFLHKGNRKRSRSWVEEDEFHGPKVSKNVRDNWFRRDSWLGKAPTLPSLMLDDAEKGELDEGVDHTAAGGLSAENHPALKRSQTAPPFSTQDLIDDPPVRVQAPGQLFVGPWRTDSELHDILRSTELRLRDGRSPVKTPSTSPVKTSPVKPSPAKTPHSQKSISSSQGSAKSAGTVGTVRITRMSISPGKRATIHAMPVHAHSRNASINTIGSAAHSLIAEATHELVLPGGHSSPSRLQGQQWEPQKETHLSPQGRARSKSLESDQSSSLSTVYSVGEQEESRAEQHHPHHGSYQAYDPFVENSLRGLAPKPVLFGPRALMKHGQKLSVSIPSQPASSAARPQFRQTSVSTQAVGGPPMLSIVLDPPTDGSPLKSDYFNNFGYDGLSLTFPISPSLTSLIAPSTTPASDSDADTVGPDANESHNIDQGLPQTNRNSVATLDPTSPSTVTSSPFDEQDMLTLLLSSSAPRRALPEPPRHFSHIDESIMPTPLSPRPRRDFSEQLRKLSSVSNVSSLYDEESMIDSPAAVSTGSPSRRSTLRSLRSPPPPGPPGPLPRADSAVGAGSMSVGNSVAELRRMNSMISSYSVASVASSLYSKCDSPTLPDLRSSSPRSNSRTGNMGRQKYLSLGVKICEDNFNEGKENLGPDFKGPRLDVSIPTGGLREARRSGNLGRDSLIMSLEAGHRRRAGHRSKSADKHR